MTRDLRTLLAALAAALLLVVGAPFLPTSAGHAATRVATQPLERAHAHNDYEHARPLLDALDHGFTSVEADVWLVGGELYLGHDGPDLSRTLTATYLAPLAERVRAQGGSVYPGWDAGFRLLIDVKSDAVATWPVVEAKLGEYARLFTTYSRGRVHPGPVTAVVSGNRDRAAMADATSRLSFYDARPADLDDPSVPPGLVAMVSANWTQEYSYTGVGPMLPVEQEKLRAYVDRAHARGWDVRFWGTPDQALPNRENVWREEVAAGVDALNTDDLAGLESFLLAEDPAER